MPRKAWQRGSWPVRPRSTASRPLPPLVEAPPPERRPGRRAIGASPNARPAAALQPTGGYCLRIHPGERLEEMAKLSAEQARDLLVEQMKDEAKKAAAAEIKQIEDETEAVAHQRATNIRSHIHRLMTCRHRK